MQTESRTISPVVGQMPPLARVAPITARPSVSTSKEQNCWLEHAIKTDVLSQSSTAISVYI